MKIEFTKMSGAGNDFIFLGPEYASFAVRAQELARQLCARRASVGADGLVIIDTTGGGIFMHYFNSDGSEASFCGNGARCLVLFCAVKGIAKGRIEFRSRSGSHTGEVVDRGVRIGMRPPHFIRDLVIGDGGEEYHVFLVEAGVPHAVVFTEDVRRVDVEHVGHAIRHNRIFGTEGTNVDFVEPEGGEPFAIRTYERGVETETLACGSGCVAAACALRLKGCADRLVSLRVASGDVLSVELPETESDDAYLVGPARIVFEGQVEVKER